MLERRLDAVEAPVDWQKHVFVGSEFFFLCMPTAAEAHHDP
ncbi:hypothetical protein GA0070607_6450 [Micromonospora coriariae]|uniref:Uncharacterized protein n=1 Tax=Micromonospora coriariae TaxID=285665 RepID=A0A1C4Y9A6_9ACTN|nr:hypothetical protein [Micromonospora coriariae]SCF17305.1 hypothetical protein GA0070607_6450 [Micromonospora coriariae]